jgi:hypothetical protein
MKIEVTSVRVAESGILEAITSPTAAQAARRASAPDEEAPNLLPVDPGFTIDMFASFREVKGQDMEFSHRADAALLGGPMPAVQRGTNPDDWRLNFDVFVFCDGHSSQRKLWSWVCAADFNCVHVFLPLPVP